ncbi:MAG: ATP-binding cassette domain-containing protein, partial [Candidatus Omnitrophica bacterium]|nr:ATP-binding cassette domain-containing protein [Candidatus Omnitrophota bacterium]
MKIIELKNVAEKYRIKFTNKGKVTWEEIWALQDVSLEVNKGEVLGIIGHNGSGKTTLLRLIAGILIPDKGTINVAGRVSVLMELGAGFNPEFTGRENIILNARIYGLDEDALEPRMDKILEFAGLGRFIDAPMKYYSQGMYMRLAFALAIFVEPDILLIDDILAVGDEEAQQKCVKKIFELKNKGTTIILVSHDMGLVLKLCNRVMLFNKGRIVSFGEPQKMIQHYLETVGDKKGVAVLNKDKFKIVFNNGRISFSYDSIFITKNTGAYTVFLNPLIHNAMTSLGLNWTVNDLSADKMIVEGQSEDGLIRQIWAVQFLGEGFKWCIDIDALEDIHLDFPLVPQYKKWLTLEREEDFPEFVHRSNWQPLISNNPPQSLLAITPEAEIQNLPSLILEMEGEGSQLRLFNTGYEQEARVIQGFVDKNKAISFNVKAFYEKDKFIDYFQRASEQFLLMSKAQEKELLLKQKEEEEQLRLKQKEEAERQRLGRTISSGDLRL